MAPAVLGLVVLEFLYCLYKKNGYYEFQDSVASIGTAIVNQVVNIFVGFLIINYVFRFLAENFSITQIENPNWWQYVLCFLGIDLLFYFFHRMNHTINFLWAAHMPHHSTEEMNYAVALRASITQRIASFLFYWPMVCFGFTPETVYSVVAFHLVLQFIPHTRVIPKLPWWIESWMNTPSHHRVHHGLNKQYIDKNMAGFLIIWDKMFGTFEEEGEEVFYGVSRPTKSWNPAVINFQWWGYLFDDFFKTKSWWDKLRIWFMSIGWQPSDVPSRGKSPSWTKETQVKYQSQPYKGSYAYILYQVVFCSILMFTVIPADSPLTPTEMLAFGIALWWCATTWGALMEKKTWVFIFENIRIILTTALLAYTIHKYFLHIPYIFEASIILGAVSLVWVIMIFMQNKSEETQSGLTA